jgi:hypothetical protein
LSVEVLMDARMKHALLQYGAVIKRRGWDAGEPLIRAGEKRFRDFRRWAYALGILLRAKELLDGSA